MSSCRVLSKMEQDFVSNVGISSSEYGARLDSNPAYGKADEVRVPLGVSPYINNTLSGITGNDASLSEFASSRSIANTESIESLGPNDYIIISEGNKLHPNIEKNHKENVIELPSRIKYNDSNLMVNRIYSVSSLGELPSAIERITDMTIHLEGRSDGSSGTMNNSKARSYYRIGDKNEGFKKSVHDNITSILRNSESKKSNDDIVDVFLRLEKIGDDSDNLSEYIKDITNTLLEYGNSGNNKFRVHIKADKHNEESIDTISEISKASNGRIKLVFNTTSGALTVNKNDDSIGISGSLLMKISNYDSLDDIKTMSALARIADLMSDSKNRLIYSVTAFSDKEHNNEQRISRSIKSKIKVLNRNDYKHKGSSSVEVVGHNDNGMINAMVNPSFKAMSKINHKDNETTNESKMGSILNNLVSGTFVGELTIGDFVGKTLKEVLSSSLSTSGAIYGDKKVHDELVKGSKLYNYLDAKYKDGGKVNIPRLIEELREIRDKKDRTAEDSARIAEIKFTMANLIATEVTIPYFKVAVNMLSVVDNSVLKSKFNEGTRLLSIKHNESKRILSPENALNVIFTGMPIDVMEVHRVKGKYEDRFRDTHRDMNIIVDNETSNKYKTFSKIWGSSTHAVFLSDYNLNTMKKNIPMYKNGKTTASYYTVITDIGNTASDYAGNGDKSMSPSVKAKSTIDDMIADGTTISGNDITLALSSTPLNHIGSNIVSEIYRKGQGDSDRTVIREMKEILSLDKKFHSAAIKMTTPDGGTTSKINRASYVLLYLMNLRDMIAEMGGRLTTINATYTEGMDTYAIIAAQLLGIKVNVLVNPGSESYEHKVREGGTNSSKLEVSKFNTDAVFDRLRELRNAVIEETLDGEEREEGVKSNDEVFEESRAAMNEAKKSPLAVSDDSEAVSVQSRMPDVEVRTRGTQLVANFINSLKAIPTIVKNLNNEKNAIEGKYTQEYGVSDEDKSRLEQINSDIKLYRRINGNMRDSYVVRLLDKEFSKYEDKLESELSKSEDDRDDYKINKLREIIANKGYIIENAKNVLKSGKIYSAILEDFAGNKDGITYSNSENEVEENPDSEDTDEEARENSLFDWDSNNRPLSDGLTNKVLALIYTIREVDASGEPIMTDIGELKYFDGYSILAKLNQLLPEAKDEEDFKRILENISKTQIWGLDLYERLTMNVDAYRSLFRSMFGGSMMYAIITNDGRVRNLNERDGFQPSRSEINGIIASGRTIGGTPVYTKDQAANERNALGILGYVENEDGDIDGSDVEHNGTYTLIDPSAKQEDIDKGKGRLNIHYLIGDEIFDLITLMDYQKSPNRDEIIEHNINALVGYLNSFGIDLSVDDIKNELFENGTYIPVVEENEVGEKNHVAEGILSRILENARLAANYMLKHMIQFDPKTGELKVNKIEPTGENARDINIIASNVLAPFRSGQSHGKVVIDGRVLYSKIKSSYMSRLNKTLRRGDNESTSKYNERIRKEFDGSVYLTKSDTHELNIGNLPTSHGWVGMMINDDSNYKDLFLKVIEVKRIQQYGKNTTITPSKAQVKDLIHAIESMYTTRYGNSENEFNKPYTALPIPVLADSGHLQFVYARRVMPIRVNEPSIDGDDSFDMGIVYNRIGERHMFANLSDRTKRNIMTRLISEMRGDSIFNTGIHLMFSTFMTEVERMKKLASIGGSTGNSVFDKKGKQFIYSPSVNKISIPDSIKTHLSGILKSQGESKNVSEDDIEEIKTIYDLIDVMTKMKLDDSVFEDVLNDSDMFHVLFEAINKDMKDSVIEYHKYRNKEFGIRDNISNKISDMEEAIGKLDEFIAASAEGLSKMSFVERDDEFSKAYGTDYYSLKDESGNDNDLLFYIQYKYAFLLRDKLLDYIGDIEESGIATYVHSYGFEVAMRNAKYEILRELRNKYKDNYKDVYDDAVDAIEENLIKGKNIDGDDEKYIISLENVINIMNKHTGGEEESGMYSYRDLAEYVINADYGMIQAIQLYTEDAAYYKSHVEFFKRIKEIYAQSSPLSMASKKGLTGEIRLDEKSEHYKMVVIEDESVVSQSMSEFNSILSAAQNASKVSQSEAKAIMEKYEGNSTTDGASFRTMASMIEILERAGNPNVRNLKAIMEKYNRGLAEMREKGLDSASQVSPENKLTMEDYGIVFNAFKPYYYGTNVHIHNGVKFRTPTQVKNSEVLLAVSGMLSYINGSGFTELQKYEMKANELGIDMIAFPSAIKVGGMGSYSKEYFLKLTKEDIDNEINGSSARAMLMPYKNYGEQQSIHLHSDVSSEGSQRRVLMPSGIDMDGKFIVNDRELNGLDLYNEYHAVLTYRLLNSLEKVREVLSGDNSGIGGNKALSEFLINEARKTERLAGSDILRHFELDENNRFKIPITDPAIAAVVEPMISSFIRKNMGGRKVRGTTLVQFTSFSMQEDLRTVASGTIVTKENPDGFFVEDLRDYFERVVLNTGRFNGEEYDESKYDLFIKNNVKEGSIGIQYMEAIMPAMYEELISDFMDENGFIDPTLLPKGALESIGFRTPTEDKYSILSLKIKAFSPSTTGGNIILPSDITTITGADFDIDKIYMVIKNLEFLGREDIEEEFFSDKPDATEEEKVNKILELIYENLNEKSKHTVTSEGEKTYRENKAKELAIAVYKGEKRIPREIQYNPNLSDENRPEDMTLEQLDNWLMDLSLAIMRSPSNAYKAITPGGFDELRAYSRVSIISNGYSREDILRSVKEVAKDRDEEAPKIGQNQDIVDFLYDLEFDFLEDIIDKLSIGDRFISASSQSKIFRNMSAGRQDVGISANAVTAHAKMSRMGLTLRKPIKFLGKKYYTIDAEKNEDRVDISKILGMLTAAAPDTGKDPVLEDINFNPENASYFLAMVRMGVGIRKVVKFMANKHVRSIMSKIKRFNSDDEISEIMSLINEYVSEIERRQKSEIDKEKKGPNGVDISVSKRNIWEDVMGIELSSDMMSSIADKSNDEGLEPNEYIAILNFLRDMAVYQSELNTLSTLWKFDTNKGFFGPSYARVAHQMYAMKSLRERSSKRTYPIEGISSFLEKLAGIEQKIKDRDISSQELATLINETGAPIVASYYVTGIVAASEIIKDNALALSEDFNSILYGEDSLSSMVTSLSEDMLSDAVKAYSLFKVSRAETLFKDKENRQASGYYYSGFPSEFDRFVTLNKDTIGHLDMFRIMYVDHSSNERNGVIKLNEGIEMTPETRAAFQDSWIELYSMGGEYTAMAIKLAVYSIMSSGFNYRADKFSTLIPVSILEALDGYMDSIGPDSGLTGLEKERFLRQFMLHSLNKQYANKISRSINISKRRNGVTIDFSKLVDEGMIVLDLKNSSNKRAIFMKNSDTGSKHLARYLRVYTGSDKNGFVAFELYSSSKSAAVYRPVDSLGAEDFSNEYNALFDEVLSAVEANKVDMGKVINATRDMEKDSIVQSSIRDVFDAVDRGQYEEVDWLISTMLSNIASHGNFTKGINIMELVNRYVSEFENEIKKSSIGGDSFERFKSAITEYIERLSSEKVIDKNGNIIC